MPSSASVPAWTWFAKVWPKNLCIDEGVPSETSPAIAIDNVMLHAYCPIASALVADFLPNSRHSCQKHIERSAVLRIDIHEYQLSEQWLK